MRLDPGLRLSFYLTLGLACLCLGLAEVVFLPGVTVFTVLMLLLLALAYVLEGRWSLPLWASNLVGLFIAGGAGAWITFCLLNPPPSSAEGISLAASLAPHLGPLLMVLLVAKLFRPKKVNDIWALQGMGLMQVALGCVLANDLLFGFFLFAYLACALWFLAQFHSARERIGSPVEAAGLPTVALRPTGVAYLVGRWTLAVSILGLLLFLLVPRFGATQWSPLAPLSLGPYHAPAEVGFSGEIDLNRYGTLEINDEVALEVQVWDANGAPKTDLGPQRWRGMVLDVYELGRWISGTLDRGDTDRGTGKGFGFRPWMDGLPLPAKLPALEPGQYSVDFKLAPNTVGGLILAEPVSFHPAPREIPVASNSPKLRFAENERVLFDWLFRGHETVSYQQAVAPLGEGDLGMPVSRSPIYLDRVSQQDSAALKAWTDRLLEELAARGAYGLTPADLDYVVDRENRVLRDERHEKVARALCDFLATSGLYTYSLDLRRYDRMIDPIEDFLYNLKQGHCERYAAALTLMLRSQGIPARIIQGFRGGEHVGEGRYRLLHSDAHSWVEVAVQGTKTKDDPWKYWLVLDPTPSILAPTLPRYSLAWWWEQSQDLGRSTWYDFIVRYDIDQQSNLWADWLGLFTDLDWRKLGYWTLGLGSCLALVPVMLIGLRLTRRRRARRNRAAGPHLSPVRFYAQLLAILARRCRLRPEPAQTPREFGALAQRRLEEIPPARAMAGVPAWAVDLLYRVRYGQQPLSAEEQQDLERQLQQLDAALSTAWNGEVRAAPTSS